MLFITIKMYRHITMLDFQGFIFKTLVTDVWRAGNQTFCQSWSWNGVVRKTDVNAFWHHLTDRSWVCCGIYTSVYVHAGKQIIISIQIWWKYVVGKWCLTWAICNFMYGARHDLLLFSCNINIVFSSIIETCTYTIQHDTTMIAKWWLLEKDCSNFSYIENN